MLIRAMLLALCLIVHHAVAAEFQIALLCTGSTTDGGWNQLAKEGISKAAEKFGAKVTILQKVSQDRAAGEMQEFAAKGYQLVIAHGYEYLNPTADVAIDNTETRFAVCGADVARPGIVTIDFDVSEASYQAGVLAARVSTTKKFGFIGGSPIPSVKACYRGFLAGVRSVLPDATVAETYTSWDQPAQNKAQAEALIKQGVDVIYPDVDAASLGVFEAIAAANTAKAGSAWAVGCVANQNANPICSANMIGSAVIRLDSAFEALAQSVVNSTFVPGVIRENLARGTCVFIPNPALVGTTITEAHLTEITETGAKLLDGSITIPSE